MPRHRQAARGNGTTLGRGVPPLGRGGQAGTSDAISPARATKLDVTIPEELAERARAVGLSAVGDREALLIFAGETEMDLSVWARSDSRGRHGDPEPSSIEGLEVRSGATRQVPGSSDRERGPSAATGSSGKPSASIPRRIGASAPRRRSSLRSASVVAEPAPRGSTTAAGG